MLLAAFASTPCLAAVPSQFIARQYTEALGRAPDAGAWKFTTDVALANECGPGLLRGYAAGIFGSAEYAAKRYTEQEQALTVYRAVLAREPDEGGFAYWSGFLKSGQPLVHMIDALVNSQEFAAMVPAICAGNAYESAGAALRPIDIGAGSWSQAQVEACLHNNAVCSVPPRTVVYLTSTLTIPAGKVLETAGGIERRTYARQARLVRDSAAQGILVLMQPGSTVRNIWVSGGRERYKAGLRDMGNPQANVYPNINYVGGQYGTIQNVRSDAPLSATHIATFPVPTPPVPTARGAFAGTVAISNNLTTGYANSHYDDGTPIPWADGISNHITAAVIANNDIVDPTDVGIVIFGHDGSTQASMASNNLVLHAGHSAYGSLGLDAIQCVVSLPGSCAFGGVGYLNNTVLAGRNQHADIMLFNGTGPWAPANCATSHGGRCGSGGRMVGTRTLADANQAIQVQVAITVDGMLDAVTSGNGLNVVPMTQPSDRPRGRDVRLACARADALVQNATSAGRASGNLQAGSDSGSAGCIGH